MGRSFDVSGVPTWLVQSLVAGWLVLVAVALWFGALALVLSWAGYTVDVFERPAILALLATLWLGLTALWIRTARRRRGSGDWWELVPERQYAGRFAESGGLARERWERSLRRSPGNDEED